MSDLAPLHWAILEDAINCCLRTIGAGRGHANLKRYERADEALEWIFDEDNQWPFSFLKCCEALGIAPGRLRNGLIRKLNNGRPSI